MRVKPEQDHRALQACFVPRAGRRHPQLTLSIFHRSTSQLEEGLRMPGASSGSWMKKSGWKGPVTVWYLSVYAQPLRRRRLRLTVRRQGVGMGVSPALWESVYTSRERLRLLC